MAERDGGGATPWIAFLVGIALVALVAVGVVAYTNPAHERANLEINLPEPKIVPPEIELPEPPPAPALPPQAAPEAPAD